MVTLDLSGLEVAVSTQERDKLRKHAARRVTFIVVLAESLALGFSQIVVATHKPIPTFTHDVAPILFKRCVKCHQTDELASSVPLTSYDAARPRAELIKQKVMSGEMPPWPADPATGVKFRNDPRLTQREIDVIKAWVDAGAPKGNDADLPPPPESDERWQHPQGLKPDLIISLPGDLHLPAKGVIPYVRILVKVPFSDDRWVIASQTQPGNAAVVHHMALTEVALPEDVNSSALDQLEAAARQMGLSEDALLNLRPAITAPATSAQPDILAIYTPGSTLEMYEHGGAKLLRGGKNMYLDFNIHYETDGKPETDRSKIALWFAPVPPEHQLFRVNGAAEIIIANGKELLRDEPGTKAEGTKVAIPPIPPFAANYELIGMTAYLQPVVLYQFQPHAHHRGKDFKYAVVYPDGREDILLSVPKFDHRWQMAYELATPLKLPAGSKLVVTAHYDNSTRNMHNPAPEKPVYFREQNQSWDEMFTPFMLYSADVQPLKESTTTSAALHQDEKAGSAHRHSSAENRPLEIGEVVGCLQSDPSGQWLLTSAGQPTVSETQATSSTALKAAATKPLGSQRYPLLGVRFFNPSAHRAEKVVVKGVMLRDEVDQVRINVTSLQTLASTCSN
jgi:hypothetical protein